MTNNTFWKFTPNYWQLALILINLSCATSLIWFFNPDIALENNLIETSQSVLLLFSISLHLYAYRLSAPSDNTLENYLRIGLIIFCVAVLLREVDIDRWGNSVVWNQMELALRGATAIGGIVYSYFILGKIRWLLKSWRIIIQQPMIRITIVGAIVYLAGWLFDKNIFALPGASSLFIEELLELNATALFVIGAVAQFAPQRAQPYEN